MMTHLVAPVITEKQCGCGDWYEPSDPASWWPHRDHRY